MSSHYAFFITCSKNLYRIVGIYYESFFNFTNFANCNAFVKSKASIYFVFVLFDCMMGAAAWSFGSATGQHVNILSYFKSVGSCNRERQKPITASKL